MSAEDVVDFVQVLQLLSPRQRIMFLSTATSKQMRRLEVACLNLAKNHRGLTADQVKTLARRRIKILASKGYSIKDKRRIATQKGGFLPAVLPIIASLAGSLIPSLFSKT